MNLLKKHLLLIFCALILTIPQAHPFSLSKPSKKTAATFGIGALVGMGIAYGVNKFFSPKRFEVTEESINTFTLIPTKDIEITPKSPSFTIERVTQSIQTKNFIPEKFYIPVFDKKTKGQKKILLAKKGINVPSDTESVSIYCRGYVPLDLPPLSKYFQLAHISDGTIVRRGSGLVSGYIYHRNEFLQGPTVVFDSISHRRSFNLGQGLDQSCLKFIHSNLLLQAPNIRITLVGTCLGALNVLKFAQTSPKNVDTLVLYSPIFSGRRLVRSLSDWHIKDFIGINIPNFFYNLFSYWFPNFSPEQDTLEDELENIRGYTILLVHCEHDNLISNEDVHVLLTKLKKHNNVHFVSTSHPRACHANFTLVPEVVEEIKSFYSYQKLLPSLRKDIIKFPITYRHVHEQVV